MAGNSPKYENLVLSNLSSPRFDISDFLKTPTDGSSDEAFCNLSGFNLPTPTFNTLTSLPSFSSSRNSRGDGSQEPDFTSLFDAKVEESDGACLDNALSSELIAFDDIEAEIARESFALFDNSHCDLVVDSVSPVRFHAIYPTPLASRMPTSNFPPSTLFNQAGSYLASEPGNLLEVEEHVLASMERGASTSGGPNALYARNLLDWGMPAEVVGCQPNMRQQATSPCDNCQLLRRIIHSNGVQDTKLEIHGLDGHSYHAVLQTRFCIDDGFPSTLEQQMVEFPVGNAEYVKQFLLQYSLLRRKEGFVIRHDSLQIPTDLGASMSIGCDRVIGGSATCIPKQTGQSKMHQSNSTESTDHGETSVMPVKPPKSNAAAQRERTGKLKMSDLAQFFHLPINAAAKELGICPTVLKKICRRNGMRRWPHRKIKSIERIIATLQQTIAEGAGQGDESIRMEIAMLKNERAQLCAGLLGET